MSTKVNLQRCSIKGSILRCRQLDDWKLGKVGLLDETDPSFHSVGDTSIFDSSRGLAGVIMRPETAT